MEKISVGCVGIPLNIWGRSEYCWHKLKGKIQGIYYAPDFVKFMLVDLQMDILHMIRTKLKEKLAVIFKWNCLLPFLVFQW